MTLEHVALVFSAVDNQNDIRNDISPEMNNDNGRQLKRL